MAQRSVRFPDPDPRWLALARDAYYRPRVRREKLIARVCRTDSGMAWHFRVSERTRGVR